MARDLTILFSLTLVACAGTSDSVLEPASEPEAPNMLRALSVSAGGDHTCVVTPEHRARCWGSKLELPALDGSFASLSTNHPNTCGLRLDGTLVCVSADPNHADFDVTPFPGRFVELASGSSHACALRTDGSVACWGSNDFGESTPPAGTFVTIGAASQYSCGIRESGAIECWGATRVAPPAGTFVALTVSDSYACALDPTGVAACWGESDCIRLDPPAERLAAITMSDHYDGCGIKLDGTITCWGSEGVVLPDYVIPGPPEGTFVAIDAGDNHVCAVRDDDAVVCWGWNKSGQATPPAGD